MAEADHGEKLRERNADQGGADGTRTCVGCRRTAAPHGWHADRGSAKDGTPVVGLTQPGRGAWVCSPACFETACGRGALDRALRHEVSSAEVERLRATLCTDDTK